MLKIFLKLVVLILAVAGGRFAYDKVLDLPLFDLKAITVTGNSDMPVDSVLAITGLERGKSIYKQDLIYAASNLMRQPGVIECSIQRGRISSMQVDVKVAEPALLVNGGDLCALSREGMILPMSDDLPVLPLVSGRRFSFVKNFERLRDPDVAYALGLYDALMAISPELTARLSEINFGGEHTIRLYFSPAGTMVLLNKSDIIDSIKRLSALEKSGMMADTTILDLRFGPIMIESQVGEGVL
jgi:cell division septal protein FtsQ